MAKAAYNTSEPSSSSTAAHVLQESERPKTLRPDSFAAEDSFPEDGTRYRETISPMMQQLFANTPLANLEKQTACYRAVD